MLSAPSLAEASFGLPRPEGYDGAGTGGCSRSLSFFGARVAQRAGGIGAASEGWAAIPPPNHRALPRRRRRRRRKPCGYGA